MDFILLRDFVDSLRLIIGLIIFLETCMDGIKNQDELFVDCGGSCPACGKMPLRDYFAICHSLCLICMINCLNHDVLYV